MEIYRRGYRILEIIDDYLMTGLDNVTLVNIYFSKAIRKSNKNQDLRTGTISSGGECHLPLHMAF